MSLKDTIASAVSAAFKAVSDLSTETVVIRHYNASEDNNNFTSVSDPETGGAFLDESYTETTINNFVLANYSKKEISDGIAGDKDRKLIFAASDIDFTPSTTDAIYIDGVLNVIFDDKTLSGRPIKQDPAGATWTLRIRAA